MRVKYLMTENPVCGSPEMTAIDIQEMMGEQGIRHIPILDANKQLVGLVTKSSLNAALPADVSQFSRFEVSYTLSRIKVNSIMITDVITIGENAPVEHAAAMMAKHNIGTLPVVEEGVLTGMLSDSNIFHAMTRLLGAYEPGIRVTVLQPDKTGTVAKLTNAIFEAGGYLSMCVGYYPESIEGHWVSVCKVQNIEKEHLEEIINKLDEGIIVDIREFQEQI